MWQRREETERREERRLPPLLTSDDLEAFRELWAEYDPKAEGRLPRECLPSLVVRLRPPLGLASDDAAVTRVTLRLLREVREASDGF